MTTVPDLAEIERRIDKLAQSDGNHGPNPVWQLRHDRDHLVGTGRTLIAELRQARAERDNARAEVERLTEVARINDEAATTWSRELKTATEQADYWKRRTEAAWARGDEQGFDRLSEFVDLRAERDALAARLERAERVVEAAMAWLAQRRSPDAFLREPRAELIRLADALDAYRAAPSTPTPALDPEVAAVVDATVRDWEQHRDEAREGSDG